MGKRKKEREKDRGLHEGEALVEVVVGGEIINRSSSNGVSAISRLSSVLDSLGSLRDFKPTAALLQRDYRRGMLLVATISVFGWVCFFFFFLSVSLCL